MDKIKQEDIYQCPMHEDMRRKVEAHDIILNGERGTPGMVGKLDSLNNTVQDIKKLLQWALGVILSPVLIGII